MSVRAARVSALRVSNVVVAGVVALAVLVATVLGSSALFAAANAQTPAPRPAHVERGLLLAEPCSSGCAYTWTLASRLGQALRAAESRFGPREQGWTLLGVELARVEAPQLWYPSFGATNRQIVIQLTADVASDERRALYQLAHEVVHLLNPKREPVSRFEEGLATLFALEFLNAQGFAVGPDFIAAARYRAAYDDTARLAALHPDGRFDVAVRLLRQNADGLSPLTAEQIALSFPNATAALAEALSRPFWGSAGGGGAARK